MSVAAVEVARERLHRLREEGALKCYIAAAYNDLAAAASRAGRPLDGLERSIADEAERFRAWTIPGLDGHSYWSGPLRGFTRNDGRERKPRRWVWERAHGPIERTIDVWAICGEKNCITLEHLAAGRNPRRLRFRDEAILGALKVAALRLGRAPKRTEWQRDDYRPSYSLVAQRFGSWENALRHAGLEPAPPERPHATTPERARTALRHLARALGRTPSIHDLSRNRDWLRAMGYPVDHRAFRFALGGRRVGTEETWAELVAKALKDGAE